MKHVSEETIDPVVAYDRIAPIYESLCLAKKAYLGKIEELVIVRTPKNAQSLLDVGAGDGKRAMRIARRAGIERVVLLEPSAKMIAGAEVSCEVWPIRAEKLIALKDKFEVVTCLWNVLGHIATPARVEVLKRCGQSLSPEGRFFLDVNHRYNMGAYGFWRTAGRILYDRIFPDARNGDVAMKWSGQNFLTYGHVFTQNEMQGLIEESGLKIVEKIFVDYGSGEVQQSGFKGNLFYVLRRNE